MTLKGLFPLLKARPAYRRLTEDLASHRRASTSVTVGGNPLLLASLWQDLQRTMLVVTPRPDDARRLHDQLVLYLGEEAPVLLLPEPDVLPFERMAADAATNNQRLMALDTLVNASQDQPPVVVSSLAAAIRKTLSKETFITCSHTLAVGQRIRLGDLTSQWVNMGYRREESVEIPGTFSLRGGIVDIFAPNSPLPARLDLVGNEIESLNLFDPSTQRSVQSVDATRIVPAQEILPLHANRQRVSELIAQMNFSDCTTEVHDRIQDDLAALSAGRDQEDLTLYNGLINEASLLGYLNPDALVVYDQQSQVEAEASTLESHVLDLRRDRVARGELPANFPLPHFLWQEFMEGVKGHGLLDISPWSEDEQGFGFRLPPSYYGQMDQFTSSTRQALREEKTVVAITRHAHRLAEILSEADIGASVASEIKDVPQPGSVTIVAGSLDQGWSLPLDQGEVVIFTDLELFGTVKERRTRARRPVKKALFLSQLEPGCYVVHEDHGIARFAGTTSMSVSGEEREYLVLEYAEADKLYLPPDHLDRISSYVATSDRPPTLTRLSSTEWARAKERVKASTQELAKELLDLYASRQVAQGHAFSADVVWQQELEDAFPYEETPDQARTIEEVKADMEIIKPMDRLVCGDVGYGKTEVALRAAFKSVNDGMQVALLVPTTILAQQHYATFSSRLSPYPLRVEVLSRFRTAKEQKEIIEGLKLGTVDIVIGTHRLIQKDVKFKNLGLVIVDEEQRFGVGHKERLKRMRREVDFLTLSATPIPRTLYMALSGVRDMSTMETPPEERFPVKTYVGEYSDQVVKEAILRELDRGGQVFFLHNRVSSIRRTAEHLAQLVPEARIAVAHGRMAEAELEDVMLSFNEGEINVLVCTTIIESGLDIPNANTLIIDRADRFGLSQLYQLRGRVGRSSNRAYSYLLVPRGRRITPEAEKRLQAILEASELGAGFRIAMRDLEIRGAGNILGAEQSGHIHSIGFELYTQLLNQAVADLRVERGETPAEKQRPEADVRVDLPLSAYIPQDYISHLPNRLAIYQRLMTLKQQDQLEDMQDELRDRFGPIPEAVENLLYIVSLKVMAQGMGVQSITSSGSEIILTLKDSVGGTKVALEKSLGGWAGVGNQQVRLNRSLMGTDWQKGLTTVLRALKEFQEKVGQLPVPASKIS